MQGREQWGSRLGFILAAVGSAIGLGNIWRFPYMAYENGGGAFFIPYLFAMLTAGIPFMILEFGLGHKIRGSAPATFRKMSRNWEWLGWWQVFMAFIIAVYYVVVIAWALCYLFFAFTGAWGDDPKGFFFGTFLNLTGSPMELGGVQWPIFGAVAACWFMTWITVFAGIKAGIERAVKLLMPLLFILVLLLISRVVMLPGAAEGLNWLFAPDFTKILDYKVWADAYGQIFYTLSIGFAIMITYSSYLPKKSDVANNAFMTVFINCGFSMMAGVMIFSVLGFMAQEQGVPISDVAGAGVGLAFVTIPKAINMLPMPVFFGTLFFLALTTAGVSSHISIAETVIASVDDRFGMSRHKTATIFCLVGFVLSAILTTGGGLLILDIVDHFINNITLLLACVVELVFVSWVADLEDVRRHVNSVSDFGVGRWWNFCLRYVSPAMLILIFGSNLVGDITVNYGGYTMSALAIFGWGVVAFTMLGGFLLGRQSKAVARVK